MIKCMAVDDDSPALNQTIDYISKIPFLELVASCKNGFEAMKVLSEKEVDLIFLDIHMPGLSGIDLINSLMVKPFVVFVTSCPEYAIEGFKLGAVDYLLKPCDFYHFLKAADKVRKQMKLRSLDTSGNGQEHPNTDNSLFVKTDSRVVRLNIPDIKYIEGISDYACIYLEGQEKPLIVLLDQKKLEEHLPADLFMRVHSSYVVNLQKIMEVFRSRIVLTDNTHIAVEDNYKEEFTAYIQKISVGR